MPLEVSIPQTPAEFYRMSEIRSLAFQRDHAYIDMLFPRHWTPEGRELLRDRLLAIKSEIASSRYVVVKDTDTDEIISQAEWHYYPPEPVGDVMDLEFVEGSEEEKNYARNMIGSFQAGRREAIKGTKNHLMLLDSITTDPKHQKQGAGSMLVKWGVDVADSLNGEAYLEATEMGRPVYEKFGFVVLATFDAPSDLKGEVPSQQKYYLMRRPITNKSI
ncbi:hypothetical protein EAF04_010653 [Stromatinia cepivora]|nr:hypothetical protein EAF04_010653 [Stromatinia cepivora]